ncbi:MAG: hypothetical protein COY80_01970 [Candidatus Pacebacteria bacterium CG_4_10_14_0_8_um_filter_42_14]|nr:MAG: hypothetical protein COY80_01970 [Candidatus Pacebacteria bacterium CG_4_10_14_0_8_um_filter_42_14]
MSEQTDKLLPLVKAYGLSDEESRVYLWLFSDGAETALELSRKLRMGRTKVYRIRDTLRNLGLVEQQLSSRGLKFAAVHPSRFEQIAQEKMSKAKLLLESAPELTVKLQSLEAMSDPRSKVIYFEGLEGLKQVSYNSTRAKDIVRVFEMERLSDFLPFDFAEDVRRQYVARKIQTRDLTNKPSFSGFTDVVELVKTYSKIRYLDPSLLRISFEVLIYNDVYATYSYQNGQIFCVEIHNPELAAMQKQLFDFIWAGAERMKVLDDRGAAEVS